MIQLQPQYLHRDAWASLLEKTDYPFEVIDPVAPPILGNETEYADCCRWYRSSGRVRAVHGAFVDVNPASGDPMFKQLSRQRCRESCLLACQLGAKDVVFHAGAFPFLRGGYLEAWASSCAAFYDELAQSYEVQIFIENSADLDPTPLRLLMEKRTSEAVQVCLDLGHAHYSRAPMETWFTELGPYIGYLHLSDNRGLFDDHLPLGAGTLDWAEADRLWRTLGRDVPITLEAGSAADAEQSLHYLRTHGYFGMEV